MAFTEISQSKSVPERELEILEFWKKNQIFAKHVKQNENGPLFVFYEGPPTANGRPGIHHVLSRVFKDVYIRYHGQKGAHIPRMAGWDCHGLPVEREVEKELSITAKSEIEEKIGLEEFNRRCRKSVRKYVGEWHAFSERLAFFIDLDDAYFTMDNRYIEAVWSILKIIWDRGLIYQGYKVVPFDPVMGATMSDAEVALGYKTVEDPSLTIRFRLKDSDEAVEKGLTDDNEPTYCLVWTTTPWTLPSNVALAVHPKEDYVIVRREIPLPGSEEENKGRKKGGKKGKEKPENTTVEENTKPKGSGKFERLICAKALLPSLFGDEKPEILKSYSGAELAGLDYEPLFDWVEIDEDKTSHKIFTADFVTMDTGAGIVHIAPAYGADDLEVGIQNNLPVVHAAGLDGKFISGTPIEGTFFKDADPLIIRTLKERGLVWKSERYKHEYPFGWRTGAPLMYFAKDAWYIRTTDVRDELIKNNKTINWVPDYIKHGRFGNWLENNRDWALSRERYWGTPLPVWTDGEGNFRIVGTVEELSRLSGRDLSDLDLHRPYVDEIEFDDPDTGKRMHRVPEVCDAWLDSGSMPYAQWGYPVRNEESFKKYFPADFISEAVDQTRGWFYTLLAVSTMVSGIAPYKNVVCLGHVLDEKGEKMSKSKGNIVPPQAVFEHHGADAVRWNFLTGAPPGNSRRVGMPGVPGDPIAQVHGFFNMVTNSVNFFVMYAKVDEIRPVVQGEEFAIDGAPAFKDRPEIDRWILSSLQVLIEEVSAAMDAYDSQKAGRLIEEFTDSLSNWYIRRNRRRFWKGELDDEKLAAYDTLYRCLVAVSGLLAPFTPYLSELVYRTLVALPAEGKAPESVHLTRWPTPNHAKWFDEQILREGDIVQTVASLGRTARMASGVKVRQPLGKLMVHVPGAIERNAIDKNIDVILSELNVKELEYLDDSAGILDYRVKPNLPRLGKRLGSKMKDLQKWFSGADPRAIAMDVRNEKSIVADISGESIELEPEDILVESVSKEGTSGAEGQGMLVAFDTTLTPILIREGIARDLVRNVQELRKKSGLDITDRILLQVEGAKGEIENALKDFASYIEEETLSGIAKGDGKQAGEMEISIEKENVLLRIWKK